MAVWEILILPVISVLGGMKSVCMILTWKGEEDFFLRVWAGKRLLIWSGVWLIIYLIVWGLFGRTVRAVRMADLLCTYGILAVVDKKKRVVPEGILLCYFAGQMLMGAVSMAPSELFSTVLTGTGMMMAFCLFSWLSKGKAGMGDAKLLGVTAMTAGWEYTMQILALALMLSFFYSLYLLIIRKENVQAEFPFVPFLTAGAALQMLIMRA